MNAIINPKTGEDSGSFPLSHDKFDVVVARAQVIAYAFTLMVTFYAAVLFLLFL